MTLEFEKLANGYTVLLVVTGLTLSTL